MLNAFVGSTSVWFGRSDYLTVQKVSLVVAAPCSLKTETRLSHPGFTWLAKPPFLSKVIAQMREKVYEADQSGSHSATESGRLRVQAVKFCKSGILNETSIKFPNGGGAAHGVPMFQ